MNAAEESLLSSKKAQEFAENEAKDLKIQWLVGRAGNDETMFKRENELRDEEDRKFMTAVRNLESKIKSHEENRDNLARQNMELQKRLNRREKEVSE